MRRLAINLLMVFGVVALLAFIPQGAHAADTCPNQCTCGGESLDFYVTNNATGAPISDGMVLPVNTVLKLDARATAYGECDTYYECTLLDVAQRTVNHLEFWLDATTTEFNGEYPVGRSDCMDEHGGTVFQHVLDTSTPQCPGPATWPLYYPGTYTFYAWSSINNLVCCLNVCPAEMTKYLTVYAVNAAPDPNKNLGCYSPDPAESEPPPDGNEFCADPVNVTTGNHYEPALDLSVSTPGIPLQFRRSYNSQSSYDGPLGSKWTHNYNLWLQVLQQNPQKVVIWEGHGRGLYFSQSQSNSSEVDFSGESGVKDSLKQIVATGQYVLRPAHNTFTYTFTSSGALQQIADPNGNTLTFTYTSGLLTQVTNNFGKSLTIGYTSGRIASVTDPRNQSIYYSYTNGDLTSVSYPDTQSISYAYTNHLMTDRRDTATNLTGHWDYGAYNRVSANYRYVDNNVQQERVDFTYTPSQTPLTVTATRSTGVTTYWIAAIDGGRGVVTDVEGCPTCGGLHKSFGYDGSFNRTDVTLYSSGQPYTTRYTYDPQTGAITEKRDALGWPEERATTYSFTPLAGDPFLITQRTDTKPSVVNPSQNKVITTAYDNYGNVSSRTEAGYAMVNEVATQKTSATGYSYNTYGQRTQINGPRTDVSDITTYAYYDNNANQGNNRAQLYSITDALNYTTQFSNYDANGNAGTVTDPNGVVTTYTYDARNRLATSTVTSGSFTAVTQYFYDSHGNLSYVIPPEGNRIDFTYNLADKLTQITDHLGNSIRYHYDLDGNRDWEKLYDPQSTLKKQLDFVYDAYSRLSQIVNPDATYTQYTYDEKNNRTAIQDPRNKTTTLAYDALDRLRTITQPGSLVTQQGFDTQDNLTSVTNPLASATQYQFDDFGKKNVTASPETNTTQHTYDAAGNLTQRIDAKGTVVNYTYDALNRMTAIQFPSDSTQNVTFTYDTYATNDPPPSVSFGIGKLTKRTDPSGAYVFYYDAQGNLTTERKTIGNVLYVTQYAYNRNKTLTSVTYPSGRVVTYTRDNADRISQVDTVFSGNTKTLASNVTYLPFGDITGLTYGNNISLTRSHDTQYRITTITAGTALNLTYGYDAAGNVTTLTDAYNTPSMALLENPADYFYDGTSDKLVHINASPSTDLSYDQNGNITAETNRAYVYDLSNQLVSVTGIAQYTYNGTGQRIKKVSSGTRIFHYDTAGHIIAETDGSGATVAEYVYLGDQLLALIKPGNLIYYYHNDHLGTPRVLTDANASVVWSALYTAFGQAQLSVETVTNPFRLPGQYYDTETGLHYNYHRYYNPTTGRYLTPDPIGLEGGANLYVYVANGPMNSVDTKGLQSPDPGMPQALPPGIGLPPNNIECPKPTPSKAKKPILVRILYLESGATIAATGAEVVELGAPTGWGNAVTLPVGGFMIGVGVYGMYQGW